MSSDSPAALNNFVFIRIKLMESGQQIFNKEKPFNKSTTFYKIYHIFFSLATSLLSTMLSQFETFSLFIISYAINHITDVLTLILIIGVDFHIINYQILSSRITTSPSRNL